MAHKQGLPFENAIPVLLLYYLDMEVSNITPPEVALEKLLPVIRNFSDEQIIELARKASDCLERVACEKGTEYFTPMQAWLFDHARNFQVRAAHAA